MKKTPIEEICETLTSNIETYFTTYSSEDYYYITYKGTPVAPKGKIKTFKNPSKARAYINSEITWNLKLAIYKLQDDGKLPPNLDLREFNINDLPKDYVGDIRNFIFQDIEIIKIKNFGD